MLPTKNIFIWKKEEIKHLPRNIIKYCLWTHHLLKERGKVTHRIARMVLMVGCWARRKRRVSVVVESVRHTLPTCTEKR